MREGCSCAPGRQLGGSIRRGSILGQVEQKVAGFVRVLVRGSSGMWVVVWPEKNMFCSCGLFSENVRHQDQNPRVRAKYRHQWVLSLRLAWGGGGRSEVLRIPFSEDVEQLDLTYTAGTVW